MTLELAYLSVLLFIMASFGAYLIVKLPVSYRLKLLMIPLIIALGAMTINYIPKIMGTPIQGYPPAKFLYLAHITKAKGDELTIELWASTESGKSRLYEFPFDQEISDKLDEMHEQGENGLPSRGRFTRGKERGIPDGQETVDLDIELPTMSEILPAK